MNFILLTESQNEKAKGKRLNGRLTETPTGMYAYPMSVKDALLLILGDEGISITSIDDIEFPIVVDDE